ncbi:SDR family NAD(P)-dependent oxidoreductase [Endozoicomonas sp. SCSIO W0465]|uniref:SDR family NAD(P)-dependent oxidoreductase n=1 Tax=Endozoicomonas sp. SCSIO W0465 TaxID=2918516 RepID=UPI00207540CC|nr:SDR family oxidoreductase [Endozoicomonas sp. SCSIO W0465]USE38347.1 SDR family oxidoreductase [Endozoicomonas sp. SCSIO W0465]
MTILEPFPMGWVVMRFQHKVVIVSGGTSGIGLATGQRLSGEGARVYNLDIVDSEAVGSRFIHCDVSSFDQVQNAVQSITAAEGKIDALFANAGIHKVGTIEDTTVEEMQRVIGVNCFGIFYLLKTVLPVMRKQQCGSVLLMGSDQSFVGKGSSAVYGMSKGAVAQLAKSTAIDYAPFNIRVNCICPGTCETGILKNAVGELNQLSGVSETETLNRLKTAQPMKRIAKPAEIASLACYLLSSENSFMTGALVPVDGGYTCQ